ncbi:hypothetical protein [Deinococcus ruber]|uniref:Uncharacterized protein n=1 Tax=Deinococcus ruber TaxID=1848197 RepID=A0A918FEU1_9DEIO|nr:hypothetical protein [Deinococcus ruber]GGR30551.1 hypothetical protein GCM10008957_46610 [Deinococcus ruber]
MKKLLRSLPMLLTTALLFGSVHAQTAAPVTPLPAQPQLTKAIVSAPGSQPMVMPLNIYTLPYGTQTIADNVYYIANYEGTGISITIQSPSSLHVASLEEMVRYQAEWTRITQMISQTPTPQAPAPQAATPTQQVMAALSAKPTGLTLPATVAQPLQSQPAAPQAVSPVPSAAPQAQAAFPSSPAQVFNSAPSAAPTPVAVAPTPVFAAAPQAVLPSAAQMFSAPAPVAATPAPVTAPAPAPVAVAQPTATTMNPAITLVPNYLRLSFRNRGNTVSYSISNLSDISSVQIDPNTLRAYQNGQQLAAQLTVRDSSAGTATGTLMPKSMLVGSVKVQTRATDPVTLTWQAKDEGGHTYPISYAWLPQ